MTDYKRLTDKTKKEALVDCYDCPYYCGVEYIYSCHIKVCNRLAELEDKIENGMLMELPCKVGDYIQYIGNKNYLFKYLGNMKFECLSHTQGYYANSILIGLIISKDDSIKILTKGQAKKRLKELKND